MEVFKCEESVNLGHYFPYDVKLRLLPHSRSFLANQKARNAIVGAENLLTTDSQQLRISANRASRLNLKQHNKTVPFYVLLDIFSFLCNETTVNLY